MDLGISLGGLLVGLTVGLTGMGGGALMTPMLVLLFGVDPLAAVSTDVVASLVMKPIGGSVHARRGTVHMGIVRWLALGSVPAAFAGVLLLRALGSGEELSERLDRTSIGLAALPSSWLAAGLVPIAYAFVAGQTSVAQLAISVGGVLLAFQTLQTIMAGIQSAVQMAMSWEQVKPLFQAATRPTDVPVVTHLLHPSEGYPPSPGLERDAGRPREVA